MEAVKIKLYQNLCNYRRENSYGYVQTYPLPTPSMIKGMVHYILSLNEYKPLKISIQGESDGVVTNAQKVYKFDRAPKSRPQNPYKILLDQSLVTATHGIMYVDLHINIKLTLHIQFYDESLNHLLYDKIQECTPVLGRNEDIARCDEVKLVETHNYTGRTVKAKLPMYVIPETLVERNGTFLRLPFYYKKVSSFEENRIFSYLDVCYVGRDVPLKKDYIYLDEDNDIICWLGNHNAG